MKLSIIIPAHNEAHRLPKTLEKYAAFFAEQFDREVEIIVVVNHCHDRTEAVAREAAERWPQVRVLVEAARIGKGGAVEMGMRRAMGERVGFVDADGAAPPTAFYQLTQNQGDAGCIIGSRWVEGAEVRPPQPWLRRTASRILNRVFVRGMFGLQVSDSQCGAKLFRQDVLEKVLPESTEPGWAFDIDLLCRIKRLGYSIREYPIEWHHVPGNPTGFILMSLQMLASIRRVKRALNR
jgi:glycosyltransferase involved in cell wall biosynthesis